MRTLFLLLALFGTILTVHAEEAVTIFEFANPEKNDSGTNWTGEGNWTNAFTKPCKARANGIGIAPAATGGQSGMKYTCPEGETETIRQLTITCMASGTGAAKAAKIHTLGITFNNQEESLEESFSFGGEVDTPHTIVFTLEEPIPLSTLTITNETDQANNTSLFEINKVEWQADLPEITAKFFVNSAVALNVPVSAELYSVSGGTGKYTEYSFTFNGTTIFTEPYGGTIMFDTPTVTGVYPFILTVVDSAGTTLTVTKEITINPYVAPINLQASDITRTGFTITWDQPISSAVTAYEAKISPNPLYHIPPAITPKWESIDGGWQLKTPIDLSSFAKSSTIVVTVTAPGWEEAHADNPDFKGVIYNSSDGGETWECLRHLDNFWSVGNLSAEKPTILLRTDEATPPESLVFTLTFSPITKQSVEATGEKHTMTLTDLPPGQNYSVSINALYEKDDGKILRVGSDPIEVALLPIPTLASVKANARFCSLTFTWPTGEEHLRCCCDLYEKRIIKYDFEPGLYLSRVYFTKKTTGTDLSAGKAIVISNTTTEDIHLDGSYTYSITKNETGTVYSWDFSEKVENEDDGEETLIYPYTVPAGGELIFYSSTYPPFDVREGAIPTTKQAVHNLTPDYTLSLSKDDTPCNTLAPQKNAIVRLKKNSITEVETTAITSTSTSLDNFYTPWVKLYETTLIKDFTLVSQGGQAQIYYTPYLEDPDVAYLEAHCSLVDGVTYSEKIVLILERYSTPTDTPVKQTGYRLLLH